jgi:hypothetical protein
MVADCKANPNLTEYDDRKGRAEFLETLAFALALFSGATLAAALSSSAQACAV